ncbi:MAG: helix-turn-helix transcriptional regulator [Chloroflexota bacterium]|jgi:predicted ArsR family transcriptional regulator
MQRTRRQILDILKMRGRATLEELSKEVGLSPVTVRVHLSVLQRDDLVNVEEVRGKVGRPYFVYSLSEDAEELFPKRYHLLANRLLNGLNDKLPPEVLQDVLSHVAVEWASEHDHRLAGKGLAERVAEVARIRTDEGAMAEWEKVDGGYLLRQYNCPNLLVSQAHSYACALEEEYIARMLRVSVTHTESIGRGSRLCSYLVREDPIA